MYAPEAVADIHAHFETQLVAVLKPEIRKRNPMSAEDIAYILRLATTGTHNNPASVRPGLHIDRPD